MAEIRVVIQRPVNGTGVGVDSFNTRNGDVVPVAGDYTTDQVTEGTNKYFPEAPNDGKEYARKDEGWVVVEGGVTSVNTQTGDVILDGTDIELIDGGGVSVTQAISDLSTETDNKVSSVVAGSNVEVNNVDPQNPIVSAFPTTTAGLLDRTYFTGDEITTSEGTFYKSNRDNKGIVASVEETVTVNDGQKEFFSKDLLSVPYPIDTTIYKGSYSGVINGKVDSNNGEQKFFVEIYKTDINGLPINSGITGQPVGDLGVTVISIAESGLIDLQNGNETTFSVTAQLEGDLSLLTTNRIRYHVGVEKISNQGGNVSVTTYYGSDHVAHIDIPVKAMTNTVINTDLTEFPSSATQYDINRNLKTGISDVAIDVVVLDGSKISYSDNPSKTETAGIRAFYDATTSTLEISIDGTNIA